MANLIPVNLDKDTGRLVAKKGILGSGLPGSGDVLGYLHIQSISSTLWTINHGEETTNVIVQIYDTTGDLIIPDVVHIVDINTIEVEFGSSMIGRAHIILFPEPVNF